MTVAVCERFQFAIRSPRCNRPLTFGLPAKVAVVFESADGDLEQTVSPDDGRLTNSAKLRGYGRR